MTQQVDGAGHLPTVREVAGSVVPSRSVLKLVQNARGRSRERICGFHHEFRSREISRVVDYILHFIIILSKAARVVDI